MAYTAVTWAAKELITQAKMALMTANDAFLKAAIDGPTPSVGVTVSPGWTTIPLFTIPSATRFPGGLVLVTAMVRRTGATITNGTTGTVLTVEAAAGTSNMRPPAGFYAPAVRDGGHVTIDVQGDGTIKPDGVGTWTQNTSFLSVNVLYRVTT